MKCVKELFTKLRIGKVSFFSMLGPNSEIIIFLSNPGCSVKWPGPVLGGESTLVGLHDTQKKTCGNIHKQECYMLIEGAYI